jgi:1-hydroxycarotenoid 3,4-desaturase
LNRAFRVAVIGAGVGGLVAAMELAQAGAEVTVFERGAAPGGKLRDVEVAGRHMDAGPTVFTLREIFDDLFAAGGERLEDFITLQRADLLARHAWSDGGRLDLHADLQRSTAAIGAFAGAREARGFERFTAQAAQIYRSLDRSFIRAAKPSPIELARRLHWRMGELWNIQPFKTLWRACGRYFRDPRLQQLFGRYATYCGSSPFLSPATLMLIAHVEQAGVWYVQGGMHALARQLAAAAERRGAALRYGMAVERIRLAQDRVAGIDLQDGTRVTVDAVVCNADTNALATGCFGADIVSAVRRTPRASRSLSAVTWNLVARTAGFELAHHSVFFGDDYRAEFHDILRRGQLSASPTVYVCAPDRRDAQMSGNIAPGAPERLFCLVNAPPRGDQAFDVREIDACENRVFQRLENFGLHLERRAMATLRTTPADFDRLFPATGGALYGPASHGWLTSFTRPASRSRIAGLYLTGGSTHPGPGVPMAATSGRLAAASVIQDQTSTARFHPMAMLGGTSMR